MNLSLNSTQNKILETCQDLTKNYLNSICGSTARNSAFLIDKKGSIPASVISLLAERKLLALLHPENLGGLNGDALSFVLAIEELAKVCPSSALLVSVHNAMCCRPILLLGTKIQKEKYLRDLRLGKHLGSFALTELGAGSDAYNLDSKAKKVSFSEANKNYYSLTGHKTLITHVRIGTLFIVFAKMQDAFGCQSSSNAGKCRQHKFCAFIVEKNFRGRTAGNGLTAQCCEPKLGLCGSDTGDLIFDECLIPGENLLGQEGSGLDIAIWSLLLGRLGIAALALGIAGGLLVEAQKSAQAKKSSNSIQHQALAHLAAHLEAARLATAKAALLIQKLDDDFMKKNLSQFEQNNSQEIAPVLPDRDLWPLVEVAKAKLLASRIANWAADQASTLIGVQAYEPGNPAEILIRAAKVTEVFGGTSEILQVLIAKQTLSVYNSQK